MQARGASTTLHAQYGVRYLVVQTDYGLIVARRCYLEYGIQPPTSPQTAQQCRHIIFNKSDRLQYVPVPALQRPHPLTGPEPTRPGQRRLRTRFGLDQSTTHRPAHGLTITTVPVPSVLETTTTAGFLRPSRITRPRLSWSRRTALVREARGQGVGKGDELYRDSTVRYSAVHNT